MEKNADDARKYSLSSYYSSITTIGSSHVQELNDTFIP